MGLKRKTVTQVPVPGGSGLTPTGAMQFQDDWPGLFIRGDSTFELIAAIRHLEEWFAKNPANRASAATSMNVLSRYKEIILEDVLIQGTPERFAQTEESEAG